MGIDFTNREIVSRNSGLWHRISSPNTLKWLVECSHFFIGIDLETGYIASKTGEMKIVYLHKMKETKTNVETINNKNSSIT